MISLTKDPTLVVMSGQSVAKWLSSVIRCQRRRENLAAGDLKMVAWSKPLCDKMAGNNSE